jgi:tRNA pseudouridine13 synthase
VPRELATRIVARARAEDFRVTELPAYAPSGDGEHTLFEIEKRGVSTHEVVRRLARELGTKPFEFGHAGLKDARAVARQWLSVRGVSVERVLALDVEGVRVLSAERHLNKLKTGHLLGNRFELALRGLERDAEEKLRAALELLERRGLPHAFESQRFGQRGDTGAIGTALMRGDWREATLQLCGRPGARDFGPVLEARTLFDAGRFEDAQNLWPKSHTNERLVCRALVRAPHDFESAWRGVDRDTLGLFASAAQSLLFNRVLAARMPHPERLVDGDLAQFTTSRGRFTVEDAALEQPRADTFEISPTGPMFGAKEQRPCGAALALEERVLADSGLTREHFAVRGPLGCEGTRRPLRVRPTAIALAPRVDELGAHLVLSFELPAGAYATALLGELAHDRLVIVERDEHAVSALAPEPRV